MNPFKKYRRLPVDVEAALSAEGLFEWDEGKLDWRAIPKVVFKRDYRPICEACDGTGEFYRSGLCSEPYKCSGCDGLGYVEWPREGGR